MDTHTRFPAVAGSFYPLEQDQLKQSIKALLEQVSLASDSTEQSKPKALIVPHAGYIYSGLTAAYAYKLIQPYQQQIKRVILFGPSHHFSMQAMAVPSTETFTTPFGPVALDTNEINQLVEQSLVKQSDQAHEKEHSLEVQLPFLQMVLGDFKLVPIVVGQSPVELTSALIDRYINNPSDLVIISTDLSHFLDYKQAKTTDQNTAKNIMHTNYESISYHDACGRDPLIGFLYSCQSLSLNIQQLDLRNSGDTAGDKQKVVGYGSWGIYQ